MLENPRGGQREVRSHVMGLQQAKADSALESASKATATAKTADDELQRCNKVYQYYWALRHPVVKDAITKALANRFPAR